MSKKIGLLLVIILSIAIAAPAIAQDAFPDVPKDHWAYAAVESLAKAGLIEGYADGAFDGNRAMTRYEFAMVVARILDKISKTGGEAGPAGPAGPAGAGLTLEQQALLDKLKNEFAPELVKLRADHEALAKRVTALEDWRDKMGECPSREAREGVRYAYPTLGGPSGGAVLPDAIAVPAGRLVLAGDWTKIDFGSSIGFGGGDLTLIPVRLAYGIGSGAELWGSWTRVTGDEDTSAWGAGLKYQLMREPRNGVNLAIGGGWNRLKDFDVTSWNAYLVATKTLSHTDSGTRILGSLGGMYIKLDDALDEKIFQPFAGLEFVGANGTSLGLEYRLKDKDLESKDLFSAVLRQPLSENMGLQVGVTNGAIAGLAGHDYDLFAGLSFAFGGDGHEDKY